MVSEQLDQIYMFLTNLLQIDDENFLLVIIVGAGIFLLVLRLLSHISKIVQIVLVVIIIVSIFFWIFK